MIEDLVPIKNFELIQGTTFEVLPMEFSEDDIPMAIEQAYFHLRKKPNGILAKAMVLTVVANLVTIEEQIVDIEPFNYVYDLLIELTNGKKYVFLKGNFNIIPKISKQ